MWREAGQLLDRYFISSSAPVRGERWHYLVAFYVVLYMLVAYGSITLASSRTVRKHDEGAFLRHRGASYRFQLTLFKASVALAHHGCGAPGQYGLPGVTVFRCDCVQV